MEYCIVLSSIVKPWSTIQCIGWLPQKTMLRVSKVEIWRLPSIRWKKANGYLTCQSLFKREARHQEYREDMQQIIRKFQLFSLRSFCSSSFQARIYDKLPTIK